MRISEIQRIGREEDIMIAVFFEAAVGMGGVMGDGEWVGLGLQGADQVWVCG
jgi:hypothetical protein